MTAPRAVRQLRLPLLLPRHLPQFPSSRITRCHALQSTVRAPFSTAPTSLEPSSTSAKLAESTNEATSAARQGPNDAGSGGQVEGELGALIRRMMHERRRPRTRLDSADEVAAELDKMSSNPMARRQGQLLDMRIGETEGIDYDALGIGRRVSKLPPLNPPVRCDAYIGRAEAVGKGVTLARAIEKLNIKLAINKVRPDIKRQRFHERPGLRRKRLKSERWRRRFKMGFVASVRKVQKMAKQGW